MKRNELLVFFVLVPVLFGAVLGGWQSAWSLAPCVLCDCQYAHYYQGASGPTLGYKNPNPVSTALLLCKHQPPVNCLNGPLRWPTPSARYEYESCNPSCDIGSGSALVAMQCSDAGKYNGPGNWYYCSP